MHPNGQTPSPSGDNPKDATASGGRDPTDGVWLTKAQLAAVRRISVASADRLIRRQGWRKHPGNDGRARVLVPSDWAISRSFGPTDAQSGNPTDDRGAHPTDQAPDPTDRPREHPTDNAVGPRDITRAVSALEAAVSTLREQLAAANSRADQAEEDRRQAEAARGAAIALADQTVTLLTDAVARADLAEAAIAGERQRAGELRDRLDGLLHDLDSAQRQAREAQAAAEAAQIGLAEAEADVAELRQAEAGRKGRGRLARLRAAWRGE